MTCKFCQSEMNEEELICPVCGRSQEEPLEEAAQTPAEEIQEEAVEAEAVEAAAEIPAGEPVQEPEIKRGMSTGKIALFILLCVVLFGVVVGLVVSGLQGGAKDQTDPTNVPTESVPEETVVYTVPADGEAGTVTEKGTYTVTDEEAAAANETVVATVGDCQLTNGQLQAFYWGEVVSFAQQYGDYAGYFGLDFAHDLDTQLCTLYGEENAITWQQDFLRTALNSWHWFTALELDSREQGYEVPETFATWQEGLPALLDSTAVNAGAASTQELIHGVAGAGCTVEDYMAYLTRYNKADMYYQHLCAQINPTDEEVEAHFDSNVAMYEGSGITKDSGYAMDVRHILLQPKNGTTDETGYPVYPDEEWAACEAEAQALLDQWKAGEATEESFAALAEEHSVDGGSNTNGGLYTGLTMATNFVEEFKAWYMDESRKPGDTGLVKTMHGYHIMYFSGSEELWKSTARTDLITEKAAALAPALMEKYPIEVDYSAISLGWVDLFA